MFCKGIGNLNFQIRWLLLIWCESFAPYKLHISFFFAFSFPVHFPLFCYFLVQFYHIPLVVCFITSLFNKMDVGFWHLHVIWYSLGSTSFSKFFMNISSELELFSKLSISSSLSLSTSFSTIHIFYRPNCLYLILNNDFSCCSNLCFLCLFSLTG